VANSSDINTFTAPALDPFFYYFFFVINSMNSLF